MTFRFRSFDIARPQPLLHTDIARLRKGGVGGAVLGGVCRCRDHANGTAVKETLEQIDVIHRIVKAYPDTFEMAYTADDIVRIRKARQDRVA